MNSGAGAWLAIWLFAVDGVFVNVVDDYMALSFLTLDMLCIIIVGGGNPKAKALHHCQRVIKPKSKFQLSRNYHFILHYPIPPHILDDFCGSRYFTRIPKFISNFQDKNGT